jgi:hypothetical protein
LIYIKRRRKREIYRAKPLVSESERERERERESD